MFTTHKLAIISKQKPQEAMASLKKNITLDKSKPKLFVGETNDFSFFIYRRNDTPYVRGSYSGVRISGTISECGEGSQIDISIRPYYFVIIALLIFFFFITLVPATVGKVVPQFFIMYALACVATAYAYLSEVKQVKDFLLEIFA